MGIPGSPTVPMVMSMGKSIEHFIKVNDCDRGDFEEHREEAFVLWKKRSLGDWQVDLREYKEIIKWRY
jgi:hypothetical protein